MRGLPIQAIPMPDFWDETFSPKDEATVLSSIRLEFFARLFDQYVEVHDLNDLRVMKT